MTKGEGDIIIAAFHHIEWTDEMREAFLEMWSPLSLKKGEMLTEAGAIDRRFCVLIRGVHTVYLMSDKGEKVVLGFGFDGSFSGVYQSFLYKTPSDLFCESLTDSELFYINPDQYHSLFERWPQFEKWGRLTHQEILIGRAKREVELLTLDARERFVRFMQRCPEPLRRIPQKYLASYLNMTPETFSRLYNSVVF